MIICGGAFAWIFTIHLTRWLYARLIEAREWHRIKSIRRITRWMQTIGRLTNVNVPAHDLARTHALTLAWEGKLDQALRQFEPYKPKLSPWLYALQVAGIYGAAKDAEGDINHTERAVALNPETSVAQIDLAWKYLYYHRDLHLAKAAMDAAAKLETSNLAIPFVIRNNGIIALREGKLEDAERLLLESEKIWFEARERFFRYSNLMLTKAFLCQTHAAMGKISLARKEYADARRWLQAANETDILETCRLAVGESRTIVGAD